MNPAHNVTIVWLRQDLRIDDNPAIAAAIERGGPVIPVYIWAPEEEGAWPPGAASRWWLHQSLRALDDSLHKRGSVLVLRRGPAVRALRDLLREAGGSAVFWNRRYEPAALAHEKEVKKALSGDGFKVRGFNGSLLLEPQDVLTRQGTPYKVFTRFHEAVSARFEPQAPVPAPPRFPAPVRWPNSLPLESLELEPRVEWAGGLHTAWRPGETGAASSLDCFIDESVSGYPEQRDRPDLRGTSRLSPHLHFGEISPRRVFHAIQEAVAVRTRPGYAKGAEAYLRQLHWREFAYYLLYHFPHTAEQALHEAFERFPWQSDDLAFRAWSTGRTGYPIVDAGMRELWDTGWMHNRVRMIVASFLVKDLLIPWQDGARWFWDTLVDADLANNTLGWQWAAGCGADAAPYFRIFNPVLQGKKFDPDGAYVRQWVPELATLPNTFLHEPWCAGGTLLEAIGLDRDAVYPTPIVEHREARERALAAYETVRKR